MASFYCLWMIQGMTKEFGGFLILLGADWDCGCGAGCRAGASPGFKCVLYCLQIMMKIKILNSIEIHKYPKLLYKVAVMCGWHLCSDKRLTAARRGLHCVDPDSRFRLKK